jgi:hypothetical protein
MHEVQHQPCAAHMVGAEPEAKSFFASVRMLYVVSVRVLYVVNISNLSCSWWATQGHYVPQLAQMILEGNAKPGARQLNLKGFLLGAAATALCDALLNVNVARLFCPCSSYTRSWQVQTLLHAIRLCRQGTRLLTTCCKLAQYLRPAAALSQLS